MSFLLKPTPADAAPAARPITTQPYTWHKDVTLTIMFEDGTVETYPMNDKQFATQSTADFVAKMFGLKVFAAQYIMPNSALSHDKLMVSPSGDPMAAALNAGLVADTLERYGDAPGSYGRQLIERDIKSIS